jgi:hypothetical protein
MGRGAVAEIGAPFVRRIGVVVAGGEEGGAGLAIAGRAARKAEQSEQEPSGRDSCSHRLRTGTGRRR